jgi:hypothetical protein
MFMPSNTSRGELVDEASNWIVGGGIVTMALFPLALPGIALAAVAAIPLLALALPLALVAGVGLAVFRVGRAVARRVASLRWGRADAGERVPARTRPRRVRIADRSA